MAAIEISQRQHSNVAEARVRSHTFGSKSISTPALVLLTSRGTVQHLSPDLIAKYTTAPAFYFAFEDLVGKDIDNSPILRDNLEPPNSIKNFTGLPNDRIAVVGPRRVPPVTSPVSNTDRGINVSTSTGFQHLSNDSYINALAKLKPEIAVGLGDIAQTAPTSKRRREKMADRTQHWTDAMLSEAPGLLTKSVEPGLSSVFAPILPMPVEEQRQHLEALAEERQLGLVTYDSSSLPLLSTSFSSLPKLSLYEMHNPHELLEAVANGASLITASFLDHATDAGLSFCFSLDCEPSIDHADKRELAMDAWSTSFATNMKPLVETCSCYACRKYSRAYIQHLLNAKEMLASTLLQLHNVHMIEAFFEAIRRSITDGSFWCRREDFSRTWERDLSARSGRGPRVRGYQFRSDGPNEAKKNQPAFIERHKA